MKKFLLICLTIFMVFGLFGCGNSEETSKPVEENNTEMENPLVKLETLEEFNEKLGFTFTVPETIDLATDREFYIIEDIGLAEVDWLDSEMPFAYARKIRTENLGEEKLSGIYEEFDEVKEVENYKLYKFNNIAYVSEWTDGEYSFALVMLSGASEEIIVELSKNIK